MPPKHTAIGIMAQVRLDITCLALPIIQYARLIGDKQARKQSNARKTYGKIQILNSIRFDFHSHSMLEYYTHHVGIFGTRNTFLASSNHREQFVDL
jgi:hypothetical protein